MKIHILHSYVFFFDQYSISSGCYGQKPVNANSPVQPAVITQKVYDDSDDPAIWINPTDLSRSLVIGTDKHSVNGGLYVFLLNGKIDSSRTRIGMKRVNNVDVINGFVWGDSTIDIAVATERDRNCIRVFKLPEMKPIDGNGIKVFVGEKERSPMGIALYKRSSDKAVFAIVSRKNGPRDGYLAQYKLQFDGRDRVVGIMERHFGKFSGKKEIESLAVDHDLGYLYYSDEQFGIRKYHADPKKGDEELAVFGKRVFKEDNEGISIYTLDSSTGYILVSDQSNNSFQVYSRIGTKYNKHEHKFITSIAVAANQSDGSEITSVSLPGFEGGMLAAMSTEGTFHFYRWKDIAKAGGLEVK